jgi:peptidoglycan/xylan/chitin deacetylase (PgdA/CDA1 family)
MSQWHQLLLAGYYYGTLPYRQWANRGAQIRGEMPLCVLRYHRVADEHRNAWTISSAEFTRHLRWMKTHFELVSLAEVQRRMREGDSRRPAVSITFDDGYADNCRHALPLIIKAKIPCTYFVSTKYVFQDRPFPNDLAEEHPPRPNSMEQLRALAAAGVEIGAHTYSHADLGRIRDPAVLYDEIVNCRQVLEEQLDQPVRYFAFPYGQHANLNAEAFRIAGQAGYQGVCSAYGGYNVSGDDPFHLQRIHADPELIRLKNWLTIDPRKWATVKRFPCPAGISPTTMAGAGVR